MLPVVVKPSATPRNGIATAAAASTHAKMKIYLLKSVSDWSWPIPSDKSTHTLVARSCGKEKFHSVRSRTFIAPQLRQSSRMNTTEAIQTSPPNRHLRGLRAIVGNALTPAARAWIRYAPGAAAKRWLWQTFHWRQREFACRTRYGARMFGNTQDLIQRHIYFFGNWEPNISAWIEATLRPGDC